jgi:hypothetical protein
MRHKPTRFRSRPTALGAPNRFHGSLGPAGQRFSRNCAASRRAIRDVGDHEVARSSMGCIVATRVGSCAALRARRSVAMLEAGGRAPAVGRDPTWVGAGRAESAARRKTSSNRTPSGPLAARRWTIADSRQDQRHASHAEISPRNALPSIPWRARQCLLPLARGRGKCPWPRRSRGASLAELQRRPMAPGMRQPSR